MSFKAGLKKIPIIGKLLVFCYNKTVKRFKNGYFRNRKWYKKEIEASELASLKQIGIRDIKIFRFESWKFDCGIDHSYRRYYIGEYKKLKCFIKISKNDMTVFNEIFVARKLSDVDFSPKTLYLDDKFNGGYIIIQELIDNLEELSFKSKEQFIYVCEQMNKILDKLYELKLVHCDVHKGNLLIDKNTSKLLLLDYGISKFLYSSNRIDYVARPGTFFRTIEENGATIRIYDDAYSFIKEIERLNVPTDWQQNIELDAIKNKIGRMFVKIDVSGR